MSTVEFGQCFSSESTWDYYSASMEKEIILVNSEVVTFFPEWNELVLQVPLAILSYNVWQWLYRVDPPVLLYGTEGVHR